MELEELKKSWNVLNEDTAKKELFEKELLKEIIGSRMKSSYDKLFGQIMKDFAIMLLVAIMLPIVYIHTPIKFSSFIFIETVTLLSILWYGISAYRLSKFDFSSSVDTMSKRILTYKRDRLIGNRVWIPVILGSVLIFYWLEHAGIIVYGLFAGYMVFVFLFAVSKNRKYNDEIKSIENDLEKLREFYR